jgi:hypothetical protein
MSVVFSGTLVSSTIKTYLRDITEIVLKVALNTITIFLCQYDICIYFLIQVITIYIHTTSPIFFVIRVVFRI